MFKGLGGVVKGKVLRQNLRYFLTSHPAFFPFSGDQAEVIERLASYIYQGEQGKARESDLILVLSLTKCKIFDESLNLSGL